MMSIRPSISRRLLLFLGIAVSAGCPGQTTQPGPVTPPARVRRPPPRAEHHKPFTGLDSAGRVFVARTPSTSLTAPGFDSERIWSSQDDWEPVVAVEPHGPRVYQLTTRYSWPLPRIALHRSSDSGATWDLDTLIPDTGRGQFDPQIAVAANGTVYVVFMDDWDTVLITSSDRGITWNAPVQVALPPPSSTDHPWLVISPDGRDVYVGFNWGNSYVAASHDFGQSFAPPVRTNHDGRQWYHSGGAVAPDGTVLIGAADFSGTLLGPSHVNVLRSVDGGASWRSVRIDTSEEAPPCGWASGCYTGFLGSFIGLDVDVAGVFLIAYNAGLIKGAPQQIWVRTSINGVQWSKRRLISLDITTGDNSFPDVAAGPAPGDFRVVWQGDLNGSTGSWNTFYRATPDGGATWGPIQRLSDLPSGAPYKGPFGYRFPYGDYFGLDVDETGLAHVIWSEGSSWDGPGGTWYTRGL